MKLGRAYAVGLYSYRSSSDPSKLYETLLYPMGHDPRVSCNCPGWTRRTQPDGSRTCRHCDDVLKGAKHAIHSPPVALSDTELVYSTEEETPKPALAPVPAEGIIDELFSALRSYGFVALQGIAYTRDGGFEMAQKKALSFADEGTIVAGLVWTDRNTRSYNKRHPSNRFDINCAGFGSVEAESVKSWVKEVAESKGFDVLAVHTSSVSVRVKSC